MTCVDPQLTSLTDVLARTDERLRSHDEPSRVWPTGLDLLDKTLSGGFRSGSLIALTGAEGLGKTTFALQVARNAALAGRSVAFFSFQHDPQVILERLVALEAGELADHDAPDLDRIRASIEGSDGGSGPLTERLAGTASGMPAVIRVQSYADRMCVHRSTGTATTTQVIVDAIDEVWEMTGEQPFVVVDYLQKVRVMEPTGSEEERVTIVTERLKDLAIDAGIPVLAIVAADKSGLQAGARVRARDMRGSSALVYEPDVLLMMNDKYDIVARHHLVYDASNAERYHDWVVLTVEKNRVGSDGIDLEFRRRFDQSRFEPEGRRVTERLLDDRIYRD